LRGRAYDGRCGRFASLDDRKEDRDAVSEPFCSVFPVGEVRGINDLNTPRRSNRL
jgi:hypothetical protein